MAGAQPAPRTWAANEQWIGVGMRPLVLGSDGGALYCCGRQLSSAIISVSRSMSIEGEGHAGCCSSKLVRGDHFSELESEGVVLVKIG